MAVRDDEVSASGQARRGLPWRDALGHLPAILLTAGLFMYAYLSVCYDRFYGRLGVDPNDVGLSYTGTLARSSGFVIVYVVLAVSMLQYVFQFALITRPRQLQLSSRRARVALILSGATMILVLVWPFFASGDAAEHVQAGNPVAPLQLPTVPDWPFPLPPLPVLAIHADPATVEPVGKPADSPSVTRLRYPATSAVRKLLAAWRRASALALLTSPYSSDGSFQTARMIPTSAASPSRQASAQIHNGRRLPSITSASCRAAARRSTPVMEDMRRPQDRDPGAGQIIVRLLLPGLLLEPLGPAPSDLDRGRDANRNLGASPLGIDEHGTHHAHGPTRVRGEPLAPVRNPAHATSSPNIRSSSVRSSASSAAPSAASSSSSSSTSGSSHGWTVHAGQRRGLFLRRLSLRSRARRRPRSGPRRTGSRARTRPA
jgi:hypothetical protein